MLRRRLGRLIVPLLVVVQVLPVGVSAQTGEISFPPVGTGAWEGLVLFSGYVSSDQVRDDSSFDTSVRNVIDSTTISMDFVVDARGQASGQLGVDLSWSQEGVGTSPTTLDPYHVTSDQHQTGVLTLKGNANRLVASGTLTHATNTSTERDALIEEVSDTETEAVEWVFQAFESTCVRVTGRLIEASGISLMASALLPRATVEEGDAIYNELVSQFWAWPAEVEDPERIRQAIEEITEAADNVRLREIPEAIHLLELVAASRALNAELAALDACKAAIVGWVPESAQSWLVTILQGALHKALDNQSSYEASELVDLWDAGLHEGALDSEIIIQFIDAFHAKLDKAIELGDYAAIVDIFAFASRYPFPDLYAEAKAAFEGESK